MVNIIKMLGTNCTSYYANRPHTYLAFHFTAGLTSKKGAARNTATWWANPQNKNGSADFVVDDEEMVQYNADLNNRRCWAVGDNSTRYSKGGSLYGIAYNCNTISIEICSNNSAWNAKDPANSPNWYFTEASIQNALELGAYLMKKYNIDIDHVVRHYDISGKYCPGIIGWNTNSGSDAEWYKFKARLKAMVEPKKEEFLDMTEQELEKYVDKRIDEKLMGLKSQPSEWIEKTGELNEAKELGVTDGSRPQGYAKREEVAAMFVRYHKKTFNDYASRIAEEVKKFFEKMLSFAISK